MTTLPQRTYRLLANDELDLGIEVDHAQDLLADKLDALSTVSSYSHALINTTINPVTNPVESWYTALNGNLGTARQHAQGWLTDIAPKVGSVIPQSIINYNTTFTVATDEIVRILDKGPVSGPDKNKIIALIEDVLETLEEEKSQIATVQTKIVTLAGDLQADHENLVTGQNGAVKAVQLAEADRDKMDFKIRELQTKLDAARTKVLASGIGLGLGIFLAVAAFALAVATGGVGLAVVGAIGVVGVGVAATYTGIFTSEISDLLAQIAEEQRRFEDKKKQVAALSGLSETVKSLKGRNEAAKVALGQVQTMWETLGGKLEAVLKGLKEGKLKPESLTKIKKAQLSWADLSQFAQKVQDTASGTQVQPTIQHDQVRLRYAA